MPELEKKHARLREILLENAPLAIAFSGGVDSAFLLAVAADTLPPHDKLLAVTARASIFPAWEFAEAADMVKSLGVEWLQLPVDILADPKVAENPPDRCYYCKTAIFQALLREAAQRGFPTVADGSNASDISDFRPGARATAELGVISPLKMAGLTKDEIRTLSQRRGLPTWNKPAYACLASRFPYGRRITAGELQQVERGEAVLRAKGFPQVRLRHHGDIARLEIAPEDFAHFLNEDLMADINRQLKSLGFPFATVDLAPYRQGSLNEALDAATLKEYAQQ